MALKYCHNTKKYGQKQASTKYNFLFFIIIIFLGGKGDEIWAENVLCISSMTLSCSPAYFTFLHSHDHLERAIQG